MATLSATISLLNCMNTERPKDETDRVNTPADLDVSDNCTVVQVKPPTQSGSADEVGKLIIDSWIDCICKF